MRLPSLRNQGMVLDGTKSHATQQAVEVSSVVDCKIPALKIVPASQADQTAFSPSSSARYSLFPPAIPLPGNSPPPNFVLTPTQRFCPPRQPQQLRHVSICEHGKAEPGRTIFVAKRRRSTWWRPSCWRCACHACLAKFRTCLWPCASAHKARPPWTRSFKSTPMPAPREWGNSVEVSGKSVEVTTQQKNDLEAGAYRKVSSGERTTRTCLHACRECRQYEFKHCHVDRILTGCYCQIVDEDQSAGDVLESPRPLRRRSFD